MAYRKILKCMNLENLGVQEMNAKEIREVDGGLLGLLIGCAIILIATSSCTGPAPGCAAVRPYLEQ